MPLQRRLLVLGAGGGLMLVQGKGVMHYAPTNSCLQQSQSPPPSASRHRPPSPPLGGTSPAGSGAAGFSGINSQLIYQAIYLPVRSINLPKTSPLYSVKPLSVDGEGTTVYGESGEPERGLGYSRHLPPLIPCISPHFPIKLY